MGLQLKRPQNIALCGRRAQKSIVYELTSPGGQSLIQGAQDRESKNLFPPRNK